MSRQKLRTLHTPPKPHSYAVGDEPFLGMRLANKCVGHSKPIGRLSWSPCGTLIASASADSTIRIWDATNGSELIRLVGHKDAVYCIEWSPDGSMLASGSNDRTLIIWDVHSRSPLKVLSADFADNEVISLAWSCTGDELASGLANGKITIWNTRRWKAIRTLSKHQSQVNTVAWSPTGELASGSRDTRLLVWRERSKRVRDELRLHDEQINSVFWFTNGSYLASASADGTIRISDSTSMKSTVTLEGHVRGVNCIAISCDERLIASRSADNAVKIWRTDEWSVAGTMYEESVWGWMPGLAFSPVALQLATLDDSCTSIRIWEFNLARLLRNNAGPAGSKHVQYSSAKIVLVGESNVGKSSLALRLCENRYLQDHERGTTHGMRLWQMNAEALVAFDESTEKHRKDVFLWDFGGQDEYQLVHQMFLHDTTLALVVIDPTRGQRAFDDAREWNKRLERHLARGKARKILIGTQVDNADKKTLVNQPAIRALCKECGFHAFYETSALTGLGINELVIGLRKALHWDDVTRSSRPELFQAIQDEIDKHRRKGAILLLLSELNATLAPHQPIDSTIASSNLATFDHEDAVRVVCKQLSLQGMIVQTTVAGDQDAIILQLPVIEQYAASLILAARDNVRGVPALEMSELGSPSIRLPGMQKKDRALRNQERIVLEVVVELMIKHGICFKHQGLLVFPSLLKATEVTSVDNVPVSVSLYYDFAGAIDNVYASLIAWIVIIQRFGSVRLWENSAEFETLGRGICRVGKISRGSAFAHLDVYFRRDTSTQTQSEFVGFVQQHLENFGINVVEHVDLGCSNARCDFRFPREVIHRRTSMGEVDVLCPQCETRTPLADASPAEETDEVPQQTSFALMTRVRKNVSGIIANVKHQAFHRTDEQYGVDRPIRILHLSDLHFTADTVPKTIFQWLSDDIHKGKWLNDPAIDYVVISGDMTHKGSTDGFDRARTFVSLMIERFELSAERFVFVPGNHDIQDLPEAYGWEAFPSDEHKKVGVQKADIWLVPNLEHYNRRIKQFSDQFYHPILQKPYPSDPARQGIAYTFPETKLQFVTLNSCWEIDQFHRERASIHKDALANVLAEADQQQQKALDGNGRPEEFLRIGVWHHPVADPGRGIKNREFLGNLQRNRVRICLNGDVHEMRRELIDYWHDSRMHVIGAGSFGANSADLSEGSPRLYNLLEIDRRFRSIRVHTRQQQTPNGVWKGWNEWPQPDGSNGGIPHFDIDL